MNAPTTVDEARAALLSYGGCMAKYMRPRYETAVDALIAAVRAEYNGITVAARERGFVAGRQSGRAESAETLAALREALTSEDEIAHGEAWLYDGDNAGHGLGVCAYCDDKWPCRTQRGIDRALADLFGKERARDGG